MNVFCSRWGAHAPSRAAIGALANRPRCVRTNQTAFHRGKVRGEAPRTACEAHALPRKTRAFTLIELLVVISIIIILMGLLFPAFRGAQDQAKKVQAKNDLAQIITAVNAFYTEYGQYPGSAGAASDVTFGQSGTANNALFNELRATGGTVNTRQIVFMTLPDVKDPANPRSGIGTTTRAGEFFDPWGMPYNIIIDGNYDNQITNPYGGNANAGISPLRQGVIAWSLGKNKTQDTDVKAGDDVISWQ